MDKSIFTEKKTIPDDAALMNSLGETYNFGQTIANYVHLKYTAATDEWNYPGEKYGWNFRIKDKKRAIVYLLPRGKFFKVVLVFGQKAVDTIMKSQINDTIKTEIESAKAYAEGRSIGIDIKDDTILNDIKELIDIKLAN